MEVFAENTSRFVMYPIKFPKLWELYEKQKKAFWWDSDVVLTEKDYMDWNSLTPNERLFIENVLAFFAGSDGIVMENLAARFLAEVAIPEARAIYTIQMHIELIHSLVYAKLLDGYIQDETRKLELFNALETNEAVKAKAQWAARWMSSDRPFAERLLAFACVEGIFFSGAFCSIFWLKERGLLPALTFSNNLIARDEGMHVETAVTLYQMQPKCADDTVHEIFKGALEAEEYFITRSLPCGLINMNEEMMKTYLCYVTNRLILRLGHAPLFKHTENPFPFMDRISYDTKENFFETRVSNYQMNITKDTSFTLSAAF